MAQLRNIGDIMDTAECKTDKEIPLTALSRSTRNKLSNMLNKKRYFRSDNGNQKDWRGLSVLTEQQNYVDIKVTNDPTQQVLYWWCKNNPKTATIAHLEMYLNMIDRSDVYEDLYENILEDVGAYKMKLHKSAQPNLNTPRKNGYNENVRIPRADPNILTRSDVDRAQCGLPPQLYDAFLLYADADINYAQEMLQKLENENNLKLCLKNRDLLAGVSFAHVALTQLIEERCQHLIVILTKHFLESPENEFLVHYTQAFQIEHKTRKILPIVYEDEIVIPRTLKIYTQLYYNRAEGMLINFWTKLAYSIRQPNVLYDTKAPISVESDNNTSNQYSIKSAPEEQNITNATIMNASNNYNIRLAETKNGNRSRFFKSELALPNGSAKLSSGGHPGEQINDTNRSSLGVKCEQKKDKTKKNLIKCLRKFSNGTKR